MCECVLISVQLNPCSVPYVHRTHYLRWFSAYTTHTYINLTCAILKRIVMSWFGNYTMPMSFSITQQHAFKAQLSLVERTKANWRREIGDFFPVTSFKTPVPFLHFSIVKNSEMTQQCLTRFQLTSYGYCKVIFYLSITHKQNRFLTLCARCHDDHH